MRRVGIWRPRMNEKFTRDQLNRSAQNMRIYSHLLFLQRCRFLSSATSAADVAGELAALLAAGKLRASSTRAQQFLRSNYLPTDAAAGACEVPNLYRAIAAAAPADAQPSYLSAAASALVEASTRVPLPDGALRLLSHIADTPAAPLPSGSSCGLLLRKLLALRRHADVRDVFGKLTAASERLDTDAWSAVVKACVMAGDLDEAVRRIREMDHDGKPRPDASLYNKVLSALWTAGRGGDAVKVFGEMADMAVAPDRSTYNAMFDGYRKSGDPVGAAEMLTRMWQEGFQLTKTRRDQMPRVLDALWSAGRGGDAIRVFGEMAAMDVELSEATYIAMIDGYVKSGDLEAASNLFVVMWDRDRFGLDVERARIVDNRKLARASPKSRWKWNMIIKYCVTTRDLDGAIRRLRWMGRDGAPRPNTWSYNAVIRALWKAKRGDDAVEVFKEMAGMAVAPDLNTYALMIYVYLFTMSGGLDAALEMRARMVQEGFKPFDLINTVLASELDKANRVGDIAALFHQMLAEGMTLKRIILTYMFYPYLLKTAAEDMLLGIVEESLKKGETIGQFECTHLLDGLCLHWKASSAEKVLWTLAKAGLAPTSEMYSILIYGYCKEGKLEAAFSLYRRMGPHEKLTPYDTYRAMALGFGKYWDWKWKDVVELFEKSGLSLDELTSDSQAMKTLEQLYGLYTHRRRRYQEEKLRRKEEEQ
ncbi:hypothetical protein ACP70R_044205 [Stipagrostis hirtigluma subsp. patula]